MFCNCFLFVNEHRSVLERNHGPVPGKLADPGHFGSGLAFGNAGKLAFCPTDDIQWNEHSDYQDQEKGVAQERREQNRGDEKTHAEFFPVSYLPLAGVQITPLFGDEVLGKFAIDIAQNCRTFVFTN